MSTMRRQALAVLWVMLLAAPLAQAQDAAGPAELVAETTDRVLTRLEENRAVLQAEPAKLYGLVDDVVLPHFDFVRMSMWTLGRRHWNDASREQKRRFVLAFRDLLVRTYATALLEYTGQRVDVLPLRDDPAQGDVLVRTAVQPPGGGAPIAINYSMYRDKEQAWKVYDVTVEGVSLLSNYRSNFAAEIRQAGLDALIEQLETRAQERAR